MKVFLDANILFSSSVSGSKIAKLIEIIKNNGKCVTNSYASVELKSKDIPILGGAIALQCTHLLTEDKKDFGFLFGQQIENVLVVSPQLLAEKMVARGWIERS